MLKMSGAFTAEVFADTRDEFIGPEHAFRFDDRPPTSGNGGRSRKG